MNQAKRILKNSAYLLNSDIAFAKNSTRIDKEATLDIILGDKPEADTKGSSKSHDFMFLNVVLCAYYSKGSLLKDLVESLCQDLERTIYTRLDDKNDELLKKRFFLKNERVFYSIYVDSKTALEV